MTTNTNLAALTEAETAFAAQVAANVEAATAARADAKRISKDSTSAHENVADLEGRLKAVDESVSAADLRDGKAEAERLALLAEGAERKAKRLSQNIPSADKSVAEIVAPVVAEMLPGIEVLASFDPKFEPPVLPCAVILQQEPSAKGRGGLISATVSVNLYRTQIHARLDAQALELALHDAGVSTNGRGLHSVSSSKLSGGVLRDSVNVSISGAPEVPVLSSMKHVDTYAREVAADMARRLVEQVSGFHAESVGKGMFKVLGYYARPSTSECRLVSVGSPDVNGVSRLLVQAAIVHGADGLGDNLRRYSLADPEALRDAYAGKALPGFGRVVSAELVELRGEEVVNVNYPGTDLGKLPRIAIQFTCLAKLVEPEAPAEVADDLDDEHDDDEPENLGHPAERKQEHPGELPKPRGRRQAVGS